MDEHQADELLRRALIDADASAAVALRVAGLPLCETLTVVFHGRARPRHDPDLRRPRRPRGRQRRRAPTSCCASPATSTSPARRTARRPSTSTPSRPPRCATRSRPPTPCSTSGASRSRTSRTRTSTSTGGSGSTSGCPAHRLLPAALVAPDKGIVVTAVCGARPLAEGKPPMGIACAQQDVARVYPLPDDPERCLEDFLEVAAEHARRVGEQLGRQEQSVRRFLELSGDGFADTA